MLHELHYSLEIIKQIESNNCKNTNHNSDAIGCYGLRPVALKEINVHPPYQLDYKSQKIYALQYAKFLLSKDISGNVNYLPYAWLNGAYGAKKRFKQYGGGRIPYRDPFKDHWYVKRFNKLKKPVNYVKLFNDKLIF